MGTDNNELFFKSCKVFKFTLRRERVFAKIRKIHNKDLFSKASTFSENNNCKLEFNGRKQNNRIQNKSSKPNRE